MRPGCFVRQQVITIRRIPSAQTPAGLAVLNTLLLTLAVPSLVVIWRLETLTAEARSTALSEEGATGALVLGAISVGACIVCAVLNVLIHFDITVRSPIARPTSDARTYPTAADGYRLTKIEGVHGVALRGHIGDVQPFTLRDFVQMSVENDQDYVAVIQALSKGRRPDRILIVRNSTVLFACNGSIRDGFYPGQDVEQIEDGVSDSIATGPCRMSMVTIAGVRRGWRGRVTAQALRLVG